LGNRYSQRHVGYASPKICRRREISLLAYDQNLLWCTWDTDNLPGLEAAFAEMNKQSGLVSELTEVEDMYDE
jgi:hypothetical protein